MNMTVIDISKVAAAKVGDEVEIFSATASDKNSVAAKATTTGTIPYEVLVHLAPSIHRELL